MATQEKQISDFAQRIAGLSREKRAVLLQRLPPLSVAQQRIWVLEQLQPGSVFYNMCTPVHFIGPLNIAVLEKSLTEVFRRHEALRTVFPIIDGQAVQLVTPAVLTISSAVTRTMARCRWITSPGLSSDLTVCC